MKTYKAYGQLSLPVPRGGKIVFCKFTDAGNTFNTNNEEIQEYIEKSALFKSGEIILFSQTQPAKAIAGTVKAEAEKTKQITERPEVTTINQAKDILRAEPYNVHHTKLRTPEQIMAQAIEHSVTFPNWTI